MGEGVFVIGDVCVHCAFSLSLSLSPLSAYLFILISSRSHSAVAEVGEYVCLDKTQTHKAILQEFSLDPLSLSSHTHMLELERTQ